MSQGRGTSPSPRPAAGQIGKPPNSLQANTATSYKLRRETSTIKKKKPLGMPLGGRSLRPTSIHIPPWPRFRPDAGFPSRPYLRGGAPTGPVAGAPPATCGTWGAYGYPGPAGTMTDVLTFRSRSRDRIACTIWGERNTLFVDRKAGRALFYQTFETSLPRGAGLARRHGAPLFFFIP